MQTSVACRDSYDTTPGSKALSPDRIWAGMVECLYVLEDQQVCCEFLSPRNDKEDISMTLQYDIGLMMKPINWIFFLMPL